MAVATAVAAVVVEAAEVGSEAETAEEAAEVVGVVQLVMARTREAETSAGVATMAGTVAGATTEVVASGST